MLCLLVEIYQVIGTPLTICSLIRPGNPLPGGIGTFEEFFEILSWAALGLHSKPIGILNVDGYFDPLLVTLDHGVKEGFILPEHVEIVHVFNRPDTVVADLLGHLPPPLRP
jgi:uncharacterized protein (TIGR00730 family)